MISTLGHFHQFLLYELEYLFDKAAKQAKEQEEYLTSGERDELADFKNAQLEQKRKQLDDEVDSDEGAGSNASKRVATTSTIRRSLCNCVDAFSSVRKRYIKYVYKHTRRQIQLPYWGDFSFLRFPPISSLLPFEIKTF